MVIVVSEEINIQLGSNKITSSFQVPNDKVYRYSDNRQSRKIEQVALRRWRVIRAPDIT